MVSGTPVGKKCFPRKLSLKIRGSKSIKKPVEKG
jgi:hypothetical protein